MREMREVSYYELDQSVLEKIDQESNDTIPGGVTWFLDGETGKPYQVESTRVEFVERQSPNDIRILFN
ncbi:MAG: hypothetical protein NVS2B14_00180 [Chamaesiphon sp.]